MENKTFFVMMVMIIIAGVGFGTWQHSIGAGVFASCFTWAVWRFA